MLPPVADRPSAAPASNRPWSRGASTWCGPTSWIRWRPPEGSATTCAPKREAGSATGIRGTPSSAR